MKISPFRTSCQIDLKSLPMYIGIHNRMVIDLRKMISKRSNCLKGKTSLRLKKQVQTLIRMI